MGVIEWVKSVLQPSDVQRAEPTEAENQDAQREETETPMDVAQPTGKVEQGDVQASLYTCSACQTTYIKPTREVCPGCGAPLTETPNERALGLA